MHTHTGKTVSFIHHGDYEGEVYIVGETEDGNEVSIKVDSEDIFDFVASYVRSELIGEIEQADSRELLLKNLTNI
ncbi:hypothetical protein [Paenibacillus dendritiformis]|uniref:hypothetical protein n=1 Tax=Paenibacillus dendritiformis TaxID=130049 RepID=UPI00387E1FA7